MRFIVYGAGAIGSTIGGHLFRTNHDVVLVGNPEHVDRIREAGLRLRTPFSNWGQDTCAEDSSLQEG